VGAGQPEPGYQNTPPPVIADFDGDGEPEIGIKGVGKYFILDKNGNTKNTLTLPYQYPSYGYFSAGTVFDLNSDGRPDVIVNSDNYFRIFDGKGGALSTQNPTAGVSSKHATVIVADVDGDHHAEIIAAGFTTSTGNKEELRVYGSATDAWTDAPHPLERDRVPRHERERRRLDPAA